MGVSQVVIIFAIVFPPLSVAVGVAGLVIAWRSRSPSQADPPVELRVLATEHENAEMNGEIPGPRLINQQSVAESSFGMLDPDAIGIAL